MQTVTRIAKAMQDVLIDKANQMAQQSGFTERERELTGSSFIVGLMTGWQANPQSSLSGLSQAIGNAGTPISRQGLDQRFDKKAVRFAQAMLEESLKVVAKASPVSAGILSRFSSVDVVDSSIVTLPNALQEIWSGSGGNGDNASVSSVKMNVRWEVRSGQLKVLELSDGTQHDRRSRAHYDGVEAGSLRIADLGYFKLGYLAAIDQAQAYLLMRYKPRTIVYDCQGKALDFQSWLPQQVGQCIDCDVKIGARHQLACRLVAERVPLSVVRQRQERLRETARQNQRPVSPYLLEMAHWTIYLTNVPSQLLATQEIFTIGRYRWQIELLFKLWKSDFGVDQWATSNPHRILCELYIKLIGAIVTHWLLLVACWHNPRRSLRQAIPTIRGLAWQFGNCLSQLSLLLHTLKCLCRSLRCCRMDVSQQHPRAFQLIYDAIP